MNDLKDMIANLIGVDRVTLSHFASGDLSALMLAKTEDGRHFVVKGGPAPAVEGAMLRLIAATGAPTPEVIAANDRVLIITKVEGRGGFSDAQADLGRSLAKLHAATGPQYGFDHDYAFGKVPIENNKTDSWVAFWRDRRLLNNIDDIPADLARRIERLCERLADHLPDTPPAALLHGDLWSGNVMASSGRITAFIDPASYYGHAEVDLAMLNLFGSLDQGFYDNYPALEPGYEARQAIYSLWPALVHLRLFGGGYRSMVEGFLADAGY
ncbi:fructosamine kinase family protein [Martelella lutilitoris]|uniref:Fructosamine kinase family protein n=1 Tax=Martelella lutilitoris TaxID=2583532 RepID=A0A5C4JRU5_9HYPH|nr:fructosamine kinase family protein [Martelella lutilitoris]TNB48010.1 fructosamine kinase family protein [Martelella lutilitoris]